MTMYLHLGDQMGSAEARDLAQQLVAWHDAMVRHVRVAGSRRGPRCQDECPHEEATLLWLAAREVFGERAHELSFLRSHGDRGPTATRRAPAPPPHSEARL